MKLKIAVHKSCKNKTNPQKVAKGWSNIFEDIEWLKGWVTAGYGWTATHFFDRHRKAENANGSNLIVIDFDGDTTLERFWETDTAKQWCLATYTSSSHTEEEHRFRALFPLEKQLEAPGQHKGAYWLIVNRLLQELGLEELKDNCGQKAERLWYGNTEAVFKINEGAVVPEFLLNDIEYEEVSNFVRSDVTDIDIKRCIWLLENFLRTSDDGEYESYFVPVMAACAGVGEPLFDAWVDWVSRGHHGEKQENMQPFKWRGLGNFAGHTTLYGMAKRQDYAWTSHLPENLRFGAVGTAVGYTETDPLPDMDSVINESRTAAKKENNMIEAEPLPDVSVAKRKGRPKKSSSDQAKEREDDVDKVKKILHDLRKNDLTGALEYTDDTGRTKTLQGNDLEVMTTRMSCEHGVFIPEPRMKVAIHYAAALNVYCPIRRYLEQCSSRSKPHEDWDRIGEVFLGNKHKIATQAMQRMMIGAVARAFNPGCSMSWIPILVGAQGVGKSQFARSLVPEQLFSEVTTPLETLMKEQYRLHVAWLLELPEVDNYFNVKNIENFKNLITARRDEIRRPYASLPEGLDRRFIMIGTTNRNQFLVDSTGNRRFFALEIAPKPFEIPWQRLAEERNALWAAAIQAYRAGDTHEFNSGEIAAISDYIQEFGDPDPWMDKISTYVAIREEVTASEVLTNALEIDPRNQGRREGRRVADVLQAMGWRRMSTSRKDASGKKKSVRLWLRPKDDPLNEDHLLNDF
jgi:predicted P-loop ATPase